MNSNIKFIINKRKIECQNFALRLHFVGHRWIGTIICSFYPFCGGWETGYSFIIVL